MDNDYFRNPRRFPKNAGGPFYTTGHQTRETDASDAKLVWCGDCMQCEAPEAEAPELLAPLNDQNIDTYFVRQPSTRAEISKAGMAARVCCVSALRYGGRDPAIIAELQNDPELCDHIIDDNGKCVMTVDDNGDLLPFAKQIIEARRAKWQREWRKRNKRWWQFWL